MRPNSRCTSANLLQPSPHPKWNGMLLTIAVCKTRINRSTCFWQGRDGDSLRAFFRSLVALSRCIYSALSLHRNRRGFSAVLQDKNQSNRRPFVEEKLACDKAAVPISEPRWILPPAPFNTPNAPTSIHSPKPGARQRNLAFAFYHPASVLEFFRS